MRPYRGRMVAGTLFGILFAASQASLMMVVGLVLNVVFAGDAEAGKELSKNVPKLLMPVWEFLQVKLVGAAGTQGRAALALAVLAIPFVMTLRGICSYLNIYLMNWSAVRTIADLRLAVFENLQNLSLKFFSTARTGELISRTTTDTDKIGRAHV